MQDGPKIMGGLAVFVAVAGFPFWLSFAQSPQDRNQDGTPDYKAVPATPTTEGGCIEETAYMRASHMQILDEWRNDAVRYQHRTYESIKDQRVWDKSLSRTCMSCHTNQEAFCGECHTFLGVEPRCWECHVPPESDQVTPPTPPAQPEPAFQPPARGRR
ncbi:MAG: sulfate reduction electron transfer complex DsrMKJOP subunit DsrJ [Deltaproteobacteria bacterium]|jgi:hypothetical protein|nr:sulfate reduction electron transfer complex DsrMKJOP subunit DsrJ [Deltaproteobacteria bacterium]MBW2534426.1 sulfate reduction electron transfer complex DsrMKJOP subunit DsrJ [Deltaproteobacteria bacterium]